MFGCAFSLKYLLFQMLQGCSMFRYFFIHLNAFIRLTDFQFLFLFVFFFGYISVALEGFGTTPFDCLLSH